MYIYKAAVVGAGTMGAEIAQTISFSGLPVILKDLDEERLKNGLALIHRIYKHRVEKGKMSPEEMESRLALVATTTSYDGFKDADIVIEAIFEDISLKKKVFRELDEVCQSSAILATNTSALSISEIGAATKRPDKVIGMHFFYPAHVMKLVEVVPGLDTSEETVSDIISFSESLRKIPVRVNECAGFLINRLLMPYLNEACLCLQEGAGATLSEIDKIMVEFGFPMGPFTLIDNIGLDICHSVVQVLLGAYGDRMQPAIIWDELYRRKRYGIKSGAGFYLYGENQGKSDEELRAILAELQKNTGKKKLEVSLMRLVCPMLNEAVLCLQENVSSAADIDLAFIAGLGFPQDKGGILHYADEVGIDKILESLEYFKERLGNRFWPAPLLRRKVGAGHLGKKTGRGFFEYK